MTVGTLLGTRDSVNKTFTLSSAGFGVVLIVQQSRLLKEVPGAPGPWEFNRSGLTVIVGTAPALGEMFIAYIQSDSSIGLKEIVITGTQNGTNTGFTLSETPIDNPIIFKNGFILQQTLVAPTSIQYVLSGTSVIFGLAPVLADKLRVFVGTPATALITQLTFTGDQNSANTRFALTHNVPTGSEPILFVTYDGQLLARVLERPGGSQYALASTKEVLIGVAPGASTSIQFILIGALPISVSPYGFTQDKLARRIGIFTQRRLDQLEIPEVVLQTFREVIVPYQWSFLHVEGSFTTDAIKDDGTITVTNGSTSILGSSTTFVKTDVGKLLRLSSSEYSYSIQDVDVPTQRLQIQPAYADATASAQTYTLYRRVYTLPPGVEYIFSMASRERIREVPRTILDHIDPKREYMRDDPIYFCYSERSANNSQQIELYPIPTEQCVVRYSGIRTDGLTDSNRLITDLDTVVFNISLANVYRVIATKPGEERNGPLWMQMAATYDEKAMRILERLESLDFTRSDVAKVQGYRDSVHSMDGEYLATHDVWDGGSDWDW